MQCIITTGKQSNQYYDETKDIGSNSQLVRIKENPLLSHGRGRDLRSIDPLF